MIKYGKIQKYAIVPYLNQWINTVQKTNLEPLKDFVKAIENNYEGIMLSFKTGITNAIAEGVGSSTKCDITIYKFIENILW